MKSGAFVSRKKYETKILVAHPLKHHVFNLTAGCIKSGSSTVLITPYYKIGLGRLISMLPGKIGKKSSGYFHASIPKESVYSPIYLQLTRFLFFFLEQDKFVKFFDEFVAEQLRLKRFKPSYLVTLQDYMPKTVETAIALGIEVWSDQIIIQTIDSQRRINRHFETINKSKSVIVAQTANNEIMRDASIITVPSAYCFDCLFGDKVDVKKVSVVPYGVDTEKFSLIPNRRSESISILARGTFRKGAHLLLKAIELGGSEFIEKLPNNSLEIVFLGELDEEIRSYLSCLNMPAGVSLTARNYPHSEVPKLMSEMTIFVQPSLSEGMSLAVLEAMASGLPVVITRFSGIDVSIDQHAGFVISDTAEDTLKCLVEAFKDLHQLRIYGDKAREISQAYTWAKYEANISSLVVQRIPL